MIILSAEIRADTYMPVGYIQKHASEAYEDNNNNNAIKKLDNVSLQVYA